MPKDYSHLPKEELLKVIEALEARKKYGLVWDEERTKEKFEKDADNAYPVLKEVKGRAIETDPIKPMNLMIEGDNYHALSVLQYTHQAKVDVIYIDPPYNTGARDWKYNNDFVDINDTYRHSKWLSLMKKRLVLSKSLLKEDGVLICAIDENEMTRLGLLLEDIFGSSYELHCISIVHNPRGIQGRNFSYTNEFAFYVFKAGQQAIGPRKITSEQIEWRNLRDNGGESLRTDARNCFYPIIIEKGKVVGFGGVPKNTEHPKKQCIKVGSKFYVYPIDPKGIERKWRYARQSIDSISSLLRAKKTDTGYEIELGKDFGQVRTVWQDSRYDSNEYGTKLIGSIVPESEFSFPKSIWNVYDCIAPILRIREKSTILDFFAGSGTTGHAVLEFNQQEKTEHNFILCTNNENKIATEVCYPRIKNVIEGYRKNGKGEKVVGLGGNLRYYKTAFVKKSINRDEIKMRITKECVEMLCIREGIFKEKTTTDLFKTFVQGNRMLGVFFSLDRSDLPKLQKELQAFKGEKVLYCFTLDVGGLDPQEFSNWENVRLEPIPQPILELYEQIYELGA